MTLSPQQQTVLDSFQSNHVSVDSCAGCLSGDTEIGVNRGGKSYTVTMRRLFMSLNGLVSRGHNLQPNIPTRLRQMDPTTGTVRLGTMDKIVFSGQKDILRIAVDNGKHIDCTRDHRVCTTHGWVEAKDLTVGDRLIVDIGKGLNKPKSKPYYRYVMGMDNHPYRAKSTSGDRVMWRVAEHRLMVDADANGVDYEVFLSLIRTNRMEGLSFYDPDVYHVHHINGRTEDNRLDNLKLLTASQHKKEHDWTNNVQAQLGTAYIKDITGLPPVDTYDITMQDEPNFLANGIVVHNSGKTTTLIACVSVVPPELRSDVIAVAFGRRNADELSARLPIWAIANTFHSFGKDAITSAFGKKAAKVNKNKIWELLRQIDCNPFALGKAEQKSKLKEHSDAVKLVSLAKASLCTPSQYVSATEQEDDYSELIRQLADQAYNASRDFSNGIDFDDMIWFPSEYPEVVDRLPLASALFVDECQDLSGAQTHMVKRMLSAGRLASFGDPNQAIYGFRGADGTALYELADYVDATKLRLSVSFRCPRSVTAYAQQFVPDITADPSAPDGTVETVDAIDYRWWSNRYPTVICRFNAPLVDIALQLISRSIRAQIRGRSVGDGLLKLLDKLQTEHGITSYSSFRASYKTVAAEMCQNKSADRKKDIIDNFRIIDILFKQSPDNSDKVRSVISSLFSDDTNSSSAVLSTIHRFKGLEDNHIVWLRAEGDNGPEQSEINCRYVACTRAKDRLTIVQPKETQND